MVILLARFWITDLAKMTRKEWTAIIAVAFFSGALGTILYTAALGYVHYSSYSVVVLLQQQLQPIWAILTASILLKERISKRFMFWAFVALVAAYFVTFKDLRVNMLTGSGTVMAGVCALLAGLLWGSSTAISKYVLNKVSFLTATALRFIFSPIFALFFVIGSKQSGALFTITSSQWVSLGIITLSTGLVALAIYYYGLKRTPARITTLCELVWPASAVGIDYYFYHKALSVTQIFGVLLLLFAIYQVTRKISSSM